MALTAVWTGDRALERRLRKAVCDQWHDVVAVPEAGRTRRLLRERPVAALVADVDALPAGREAAWIEGTRRRFPSLRVAVVSPGRDPGLLHELGCAGLRHLILREEGGEAVLQGALRVLLGETVVADVARRLSPLLGRTDLHRLRAALEWTHRRPGADDFAAALGVSRPHLSRLLAASGLPSTGHLLTWARLLHAGAWLPDPGRSGESVGRQLEYANGSTFRRALRNFVGCTPTEVAEGGGVERVLDAFVHRTGLGPVDATARRVA